MAFKPSRFALTCLAGLALGAASLPALAQSTTPGQPSPPPQAAPSESQKIQIVQSLNGEEVAAILEGSPLQLEALDVPVGWAFKIAANEQLGFPPTLMTGELCSQETSRCSVLLFSSPIPNPEDKEQLRSVLSSYNAATTLTRAIYDAETDNAMLEYPLVMAGGVTLGYLEAGFASWPQFYARFMQMTGVAAPAPAAPAPTE
ncbi:MAG: hypothetical protein CMK07_09720 [Ponticaulis sp.]|nr:hypothetical protein [Ponticaulis sp.]